MSALRQVGPRAVLACNQTPNTVFKRNLSLLAEESTLSRYIHEQPSISSHLSLGNSGYQTLKSQSMRLIFDDIDTMFGPLRGCDCCQVEGAHDMKREIDEIVRMEQARRTNRR